MKSSYFKSLLLLEEDLRKQAVMYLERESFLPLALSLRERKSKQQKVVSHCNLVSATTLGLGESKEASPSFIRREKTFLSLSLSLSLSPLHSPDKL